MNDFVERRTDLHRQMLVEVGVRLDRLQGQAYGLQFLKDVHVPAGIIERVLAEPTLQSTKRHVRHVSYATVATVESMISADR